MKMRMVAVFVVVGALMAPAGAALAVADERAPCMGKLTSVTATTTQGQGIAALAVAEGQSGAIKVIVPPAAQSPNCP